MATLKEQAEELVALCGQLDAKRAEAWALIEQIRTAETQLWQAMVAVSSSAAVDAVKSRNAVRRIAVEYLNDLGHPAGSSLAAVASAAYAPVL
ncbi:MAG: hypothetical protein HC900_00035 [Methylacidiphilales bacterium]|nr:hypothetical protein [Candidatus Methylacidiphilales bacterium]